MSVSTASIVMMAIVMVIGVAIPVGLFFAGRKLTGGSVKAFFVGCGVMFLFAMVLESTVHSLIYATPLGKTIWGNMIFYGIYAGFMAGLFEETGRFLGYKVMLKKQLDNDGNALMYGAGHGGFEAFYILFFNMLNQILYAVLINSGNYLNTIDQLPADQKEMVLEQFQTLAETPASTYLLAVVERGGALVAQMGLSVIVWFAVSRGGRKLWLYGLAILLHMLLDTSMVIFNYYTKSIFWTEVLIWVCAILIAALAVWLWKREHAGPVPRSIS